MILKKLEKQSILKKLIPDFNPQKLRVSVQLSKNNIYSAPFRVFPKE